MSDTITPGNKRDKWTLRATELLNWLIDHKSAVLTAGDNITLTPQQDGTIEISASGGGEGTVTDVLVDGVSVVNQDGEAEITMPSDFTGATSQQAGTHGLVPAPTIADKDKVLKGDGTWAEAGGGNVDDVKVNGTSVVDANKVAQIVSYKEVTQAEYDALPASKLTDGIAYFIKDANLPSRPIIYSPIIYSLEERCVGVWTDGKPLYQKSFIKNNLTFSSYKDLFASGDLESTIRIQTYNLYFSLSSTFYVPVVPANYYDASNYRTYSHLQSSTNIKYYAVWYGASGLSALVTIQYTKTTDVPGSGQWAQDGIPAVHYSTDEKVIGTWISRIGNEVPLYEKVIRLGSSPNSSGQDAGNVSTNILSDLNIVELVEGYYYLWTASVGRRESIQYNTNTKLVTNKPSSPDWMTHILVRYTKSL